MALNHKERLKEINDEIASVEKQIRDGDSTLKEKLRRLKCDQYMVKLFV